MSYLKFISHGFHQIQRTFFPDLEHEAGPIPQTLIKLTYILSTIHSVKIPLPDQCWTGRPRKSRLGILNAFIAKAFLNVSTTLGLVERLQSDNHLRLICGFESRRDIPSESVFSRVFAEFSKTSLPAQIHEAIVKNVYDEKITLHIARDSTAVESREKPAKKGRPAEKNPFQNQDKGRRRKGRKVSAKEPTRIQKQLKMPVMELQKDLPRVCDKGSKKNSQGYVENWNGYKLHIDTADGGIPVSVILSSASLHDSQVAIPLAMMTAERVQNLYDLMDSAYDVKEIADHSRRLNHVPIIDRNPRRDTELKEVLESEQKAQDELNWKPAESRRYHQRTVAERTNARLKDEFGGRTLRVRGPDKVFCHLMIGVLVLTVDQLMRLIR